MFFDLYIVNAFSKGEFTGNPAAVVPLDFWIPDTTMQNIAMQNNLSETAFFVKNKNGFHIRWFTPKVEVDLCGHATLASAHVIFEILKIAESEILFESKSGTLRVFKEDGLIFLDFPSADLQSVMQENNIFEALSSPSILSWSRAKDDFLLEFSDEISIKELSPDFHKISQTEARGVIVTSQSSEYDFVCRFFAPRVGINEDPVTGSAFTKLIPFWSKKLNKEQLFAKQISDRGGEVNCKFKGERVCIGGNASVYLKGRIEI
ncbi:MAG: PhzF family phenazine biosynthesis protein [Cytophagaceae bacterium]|nr:PhzF family phenazine biosynthesis protein [Cytophagaceae bacterium]MBK9932815.1 PhzF family phenazine biosynthesis protein [Cytophagaceae bacterium]MBL0303495.1 PhzF family phenazine biosynthesis protein [Cytophagaceae bacterium]MBL0326321.1 PhzF family phenazine biosynthesis protein [Cytophagaceae bacterium]